MSPVVYSNSRSTKDEDELWSKDSTPTDDSFSKLDEAIQLGRIETRRSKSKAVEENEEEYSPDDASPTTESNFPTDSTPSAESEFEPDPLVMVCRNLEIPLKNIDSTIIKCMSAAMQEGCPNSYQEAVTCLESKQWIQAMNEEMESIKKAKTWKLSVPDANIRPIKCRWVFRKKFDSDGK